MSTERNRQVRNVAPTNAAVTVLAQFCEIAAANRAGPRLRCYSHCMRICPAGRLMRSRVVALIALLVAMEIDWSHAAVVGAIEEAQVLTQAGRTQLTRRNFTAAQTNFARAVELVEAQSGPGSLQLVEPLIGLADTLIAAERPKAAVEPLRRAVASVRRSAGLYDLRQYDLLLQLVDLQSRMSDTASAADDLSYMARVSESAHGKQSAQHGRALAQIGDWQCRIGQFTAGRASCRQAVKVLEAHGNGPELIEALLGLAQCSLQQFSAEGIATTPDSLERYRGPIARSGRLDPDSPAFSLHIGKFMRAEGQGALRRAVRLIDTLPQETQLQIRVLLQAGDWFLIKGHTRAAQGYYARAEALLAKSEAGPDRPLSAPLQILYPVPARALRNRDLPAAAVTERFIELEFTVRANGEIERARVVGRDLGIAATNETRAALHAARFRPRIVNGKPVDTEGVRLRQVFYRRN
jgi:tetratricopeptide (TPR) repeat protein